MSALKIHVPEAEPSKKPLPPYLSYKTFQSFVESLKVGLPRRIDRSVMSSLSGATQSWLLGALRFLDLTNDDGKPTDRLHHLAKAQGPERQKQLQEMTRSAYPSLFADDFLLSASPRQLEEAITKLGPTGDTVRRAVTFVVALARDAGLQMSPHIKRTTRMVRAPKRRRAANGIAVNENRDEREKAQGLSWPELLVSKFPTFDPAWPDDVKAKWFDAFKLLMDRQEGK